jgi:hypothetical protein
LFIFSGDTFEAALTAWEAAQIAAYPHKDELIRTLVLTPARSG